MKIRFSRFCCLSQIIAKGTTNPSIEYFDTFNTFSPKQKLQQALKSWSNLDLVLFGREIRITTFTNPSSNFNKYDGLDKEMIGLGSDSN